MRDELDHLRAAHAAGERIFTVHYACQNFHEVKDRPASVACVAFYNIQDGSSAAFSLASVGESNSTTEEKERLLLDLALNFMRDNGDARWFHWKMNRPEYGFTALQDRLRWLRSEPPASPPKDRLHDIEQLVKNRYGTEYAKHPRLPNLLTLNSVRGRYARWGGDEPSLVSRGEFMAVQQSTTEKVRMMSDLLKLLFEGRLLTATSAGDVRFADSYLDAVKLIHTIGDRFDRVRKSLLTRHDRRSTLETGDEYDAQDLFRALLQLYFDDIRDEEWTPSYAGSASRIDFVLPQVRLAVELKWTRASMSTKELGEQLLVDREKYKKHQDVGHLVCLVFDYDWHVKNPGGIEADIREDGTAVSLPTTVKIVR